MTEIIPIAPPAPGKELLKSWGWGRYSVKLLKYNDVSPYGLSFERIGEKRVYFTFHTLTELRKDCEDPQCALKFYVGGTGPDQVKNFLKSFADAMPASEVPAYDIDALVKEAYNQLWNQIKKVKDKHAREDLQGISLDTRVEVKNLGPEGNYEEYVVFPTLVPAKGLDSPEMKRKQAWHGSYELRYVVGPVVYVGNGRATREIQWEIERKDFVYVDPLEGRRPFED